MFGYPRIVQVRLGKHVLRSMCARAGTSYVSQSALARRRCCCVSGGGRGADENSQPWATPVWYRSNSKNMYFEVQVQEPTHRTCSNLPSRVVAVAIFSGGEEQTRTVSCLSRRWELPEPGQGWWMHRCGRFSRELRESCRYVIDRVGQINRTEPECIAWIPSFPSDNSVA